MDAKAFEKALKSAKHGSKIIYHCGLLMRDRQLSEAINDTAKKAWRMYETGWCLLFQSRVTPGSCDYIATRISR